MKTSSSDRYDYKFIALFTYYIMYIVIFTSLHLDIHHAKSSDIILLTIY